MFKVSIASAIVLLIWLTPGASGQSYVVETESGPITFYDLVMPISTICKVRGWATNDGKYQWEKISFDAVLSGDGTSTEVWFHVDSLPIGVRVPVLGACRHAGQRPFAITGATFTQTNGSRTLSEAQAAEEAKIAAQKAAEKLAKDQADERSRAARLKARADFIAKLPTLQSGFTSAFIASDKKCSAQFLEATAMEGLEKRKRLADLVSFGCGFIVDNGAHLSVGNKDVSFAVVTLVDGASSGRSGWVPASWIKSPPPPAR